jgi:hypothetical protein
MDWKDTRTSTERLADEAYARARDAGRRLDAALDHNIREGRPRMSLKGKMAALTERAQDFTKATETGLDALSEKIAAAEAKREAALEKHHGYYDGIIAGIEESVTVIDRLTNLPLDKGSENSGSAG